MSALDVEVGTVLFFPAGSDWAIYPKVKNRLYIVVRKTATQLVVRASDSTLEVRVRIKDGCVVGDRGFTTMQVATVGILAEHKAQVAERNRYVTAAEVCRDLIDRPLHQLRLTTAQLEHLAKAWKEVKEMGGTNEQQP